MGKTIKTTKIKKNVEEEQIEMVQEQIEVQVEEEIISDKKLYETFIKKNNDFEFYSKGVLIFDTKLSKDTSVFKFYDNYFTVFNTPYNYEGIKIKLNI